MVFYTLIRTNDAGCWSDENILEEFKRDKNAYRQLTEITTPIKIDKYQEYLIRTKFDRDKSKYLIEGFRQGFDIGYRGPMMRQDNAANIPLRIGTSQDVWDKLNKEVLMNRYAGPFKKIPYKYYMQSPIGLVPKSGNKMRLIFHLSYNFGSSDSEDKQSLNYFTPKEWSKVQYKDLDYAIRTCLKLGRKTRNREYEAIREQVAREIYSTIYFSKTDLESAFRLVPIKPGQRCWLVMMTRNPENNELAFFVDKCLPFRASISCARFQLYSDSLRHIIEHVTKRYFTVTNYLDDFLFITNEEESCNQMVRRFIDLCSEIGCPCSIDKIQSSC